MGSLAPSLRAKDSQSLDFRSTRRRQTPCTRPVVSDRLAGFLAFLVPLPAVPVCCNICSLPPMCVAWLKSSAGSVTGSALAGSANARSRLQFCMVQPHPNRGIDRVFETAGVVGRGLVSIAEVHAIVARAHLAKFEPEMTSDRFRFSERHGFASSGSASKASR